jgi:hypothetical protein
MPSPNCVSMYSNLGGTVGINFSGNEAVGFQVTECLRKYFLVDAAYFFHELAAVCDLCPQNATQ